MFLKVFCVNAHYWYCSAVGLFLYICRPMASHNTTNSFYCMDSVEKTIKDSDFALENLRHLETIHPKWVEELNNTDWTNRPIGYQNQVTAIDDQEKAFSRETGRYLELRVIEWLSSVEFAKDKQKEMLRDAFRTAAKILTSELKDAKEGTKEAPKEPTLGI